MRGWSLRIAGAAFVAAVVVACTLPQPNEPSNVIVTQNQTVGGGGTAPGASPSPGATCGVVASNRVGFFGIGCPSGVAPRNGQGVLPLGCTGFCTSTPKRADGSDASSIEHGQDIKWEKTAGTERFRLVDVEEAFNKNVVPEQQGEAQITATVTPRGCSAIPGTLNFQVTAATSSAGDVMAARAAMDGDRLLVYSETDGTLRGEYRLGDPWPQWLKDMAREGIRTMDAFPPPPGDPPPADQPSGGSR